MPLAAGSLVSLTLALVSAAPPAPVEAPRPAAGVTLRYRFTPGESVVYRIEQETTYLAAKGQIREKNASRAVTDQKFEVLSVDADGTATLRLAIGHAHMEYAFNDEKPSVFDTAENTAPAPIFAGVRQAIGRPLAEIRVRPDGTMTGIRPLIAADEMNAIPGKAGLEGDGPSSLFTVFPARPLKTGDEWSDTFTVKVSVTKQLQREVKILRQYRLEAVEGGIARISEKSAVVTPVTDPQQSVQLIQRTYSGTIAFDLRAGRVTNRTTSFDNTEIGWAGEDSSYRAVGNWKEQLSGEPAAVSAR
jgi:hypothetical protein